MQNVSSSFDTAPQRLQDPSNANSLDLRTFMVTFVSHDVDTKEQPTINGVKLQPGTILAHNDRVETHDGRVEIRDNLGAIFRLRGNSSFEVGLTEDGYEPVMDGYVYKFRRGDTPAIAYCGKYVTSCYMCQFVAVIEPLSDTADRYYSFGTSNIIFEYDENGRKFTIAALDEDEYAELHYDSQAPMRQRYVVKNRKRISDDEFDRITQEYINDRYWL